MVWPGYQPRGYDAEDMGALVPHLASLASPDIELVLGNVYMEAELADILHQLADQGWTKLSLTEVRLGDIHTHTHTHTHTSGGLNCL